MFQWGKSYVESFFFVGGRLINEMTDAYDSLCLATFVYKRMN
ncbi:transposase [Bacillus cereus]|nr:hypothetical protein bcere0018_31850 [Bacillus cereus Rock1-15]MEB8738889.1 hypothetical protein [Bacillus cereus]OPA24491.1 transposase [Bacillus cereus]